MKSGKLNFLEPSGLLQACNGTDLPFLLLLEYLAESGLAIKSTDYVTIPLLRCAHDGNVS